MNTLRIIGSGIKGILHLTQESLLHCNKARKILSLGWIENLKQVAIDNNWNHEDITSYYENGAIDTNNYARIKMKINQELFQHQDIALILLGHPRLGVTIVQEFQEESDNGNVMLHVLPGISSFDTMINDLKIDPIEEGSCLVDVNRLILYDYHMDSNFNYFIYHVCSIGNIKTDYKSPNTNNAVLFLKEKLLKHFPIEHEIYLLNSSSTQNDKSIFYKEKIFNLNELLQNVTFDTSLFIPAMLPSKSRINMKFYNYIMNP